MNVEAGKARGSREGLKRAKAMIRRHRVFIALSVFLVVLPLWAEPLSSAVSIPIVYTMRMVGVFTIAVVGLNLLMGYAGQISLGHGAFFGVGAYASALLTTKVHFPVWAGLAAAVLFSALVGLLVAPILRLKGHYLAMATLGLGLVAFVFFRELTWLTGGNIGVREVPDLAFPGFTVSTRIGEYYAVWAAALLVLLLCSNLINSRSGRALRALHQSEVAAEAMGVNVAGYKIKVFVISSALAGLAGAVFAHLQGYIDPNQFGILLSIELVTMTVVGGMASIWGAVAGSGLLLFIPKFVEALPKWLGEVPAWVKQYSNYEGLIFGLILILTMIFMPSGIARGISDFFRYRRSPFVNPFRRKEV
jgi:branched-chain amino acid transport system permease protein